MNITIRGVQVSVQDSSAAEIVLQHLLQSETVTLDKPQENYSDRKIPRIGDEWTGQGGTYAGVARGRDGQPDYHLIVGPEFDGTATWNDALTWAQKIMWGGHSDFSLPTRKEQALMFANVSELFKPEWYWSSEQHASDSSGAWGQGFANGDQNGWIKGSGRRARAVRRLPI